MDPTNPLSIGRTCDEARCNAAGGNTGGKYPGETWGCYKCGETARVGFLFLKNAQGSSGALELEVYHTVQRWESLATNNRISRTITGDNFQACCT